MSTVVENAPKVRRTKLERLLAAVNGTPKTEDKAAKIGLVPAALTAIQNLESIVKFEPTPKQKAQILAALQAQLEQLTEAFAETTEAPTTGFTLQA